ncbi:hypothetical protein PLIP_a2986 [Pseudoalteromonas lipolytica LMEB 39]|nr:hypothetical protein [Pseudoalteromonas lipolytica LMEB 39]
MLLQDAKRKGVTAGAHSFFLLFKYPNQSMVDVSSANSLGLCIITTQ